MTPAENQFKFDIDKPAFEYITKKDRAIEVLEDLSKEKVIAVDVESNSLDAYTGVLFLVQIGTEEKSYIFDARKIDLKEIPQYKELLEDKNKIKLLQNARFDYKFLKLQTGVVINNIFDVYLADQVLEAGLGRRFSMQAITSRYFPDVRLDKDLQKSFVDQPKSLKITKDQLKYAGLDTLILFPIFKKQIQRLKKENLLDIAKLEFATTAVVAEMELYGIYVDQEKWREIIKSLEKKRTELANQFQEAIRPYYNVSQEDLFGNTADSININSNQQLMDLFNNRLHLNLPSTSTGVLSNVDHPIVNILKDYRKIEKTVSSFGDSVLDKINPVTNRIHPEFHQLRAATGRFACQNPNIQQIPRNSEDAPFRECFNPAEGYKLVVSDYSQFEMRVLAELSGDENLRRAYSEGLDLHSYTAALMFDKPYSKDFKKLYPEFRQMAKPLNFGIMYGLSPIGLSRQMKMFGKDVSVDEAEDLINKYFKGYPGVKRYLDRQSKFVMQHKYSQTPAGRKRWYNIPDKTDPEYNKKISGIKNAAKNHPIQGTNADAIKYALVFVQERMKKEGIDGGIILTVHDEIVCEIQEDRAEEFAQILSEEMIKAAKMYIKEVPVKSDPFVGDVWEH